MTGISAPPLPGRLGDGVDHVHVRPSVAIAAAAAGVGASAAVESLSHRRHASPGMTPMLQRSRLRPDRCAAVPARDLSIARLCSFDKYAAAVLPDWDPTKNITVVPEASFNEMDRRLLLHYCRVCCHSPGWMLRPSRAVELTNATKGRRGGVGDYHPVTAGLPRKMTDDPRIDRQGTNV